jgi:predicted outer membrane repeat protein
LTLTRSTVSGNSANGNGGGISVDGLAGAVTLNAVNSTVAGNRSGSNGGGIAAINAASAQLNGVTVARNIADSDGTGDGFGGGLFQESGSSISSRNSLLALNTINYSTTTGLDCYGATNFTTGGHNLRTHANGCMGFNGTGDIVRHNPRIGQLASNGGPTQTIALKSGSPAIDRGGSNAPGHDQRGVAAHGKRDIGAFEFVP